ncbi:hypothetical protein J9253_01100 [Thiothrix litoralis]|jgi:hypothetical protein|uniref:Uncharacterized protein n=1 Tax=Thiothrix litoralis TaxID=2891210 RepID=A0ABX7WRT3_9GAMM|nr:hypothetical protein [Thiothrix litoralis]QTR46586.1 hypothetical protein J9253_01100 [Thiothrix litoralis]
MAQDGSDWDYINEHMGGHDEDGLPNFMNTPYFGESCRNNECKSYLPPTVNLFDYENLAIEYNLSRKEVDQIKNYIAIYSEHDFKNQSSTNNYITKSKRWDEFSEIRSLNDHGLHTNIPGILPKFYKITCEIFKISKGNGAQLTKATKY